MNTKDVGDIAEQIIILDMLKCGYVVSRPIGDNAAYDLIVDTGTEILRVQVKGRSAKKDALVVQLYTTVFESGGSNNRTKMVPYNLDVVDVFAVVDNDTSECYYVHSNELTGAQSFNLRLKPARNNQKKGIRFASDYRQISGPNGSIPYGGVA
jgi:hypothetical protein